MNKNRDTITTIATPVGWPKTSITITLRSKKIGEKILDEAPNPKIQIS